MEDKPDRVFAGHMSAGFRGDCLRRIRDLEKAGRLADALAEFERLLAAEAPVFSAALLLEYGRLLWLDRQSTRALAVWEQLVLDPSAASYAGKALYNLAKAQAESGQSSRAAALYERLLALEPETREALFNLANLRQKTGAPEAALPLYRRLLALEPGRVEAWINCARACKSCGDYERAEFCLGRALALAPTAVTAHWNLAHVCLSQGRFAEGWAEYEWRLRRPEAFIPAGVEKIAPWRGENLRGRRLLLWSEQGAGDAIQFVRFAAKLSGPPACVALLCQDNLRRLLQSAPGIDLVLPFSSLPEGFDFQLSLLSLPWRLGLHTQAELSARPYLAAGPPVAKGGPAGVGKFPFHQFDDSRIKVGLVWSGNPFHVNDARRSIAFSELAPLGRIAGMCFFSLQKAVKRESLPQAQREIQPLIDLAPWMNDFAATAWVLQQLDLLLSVDTAVAHLAGALGVPAWILLPCEADWRWGLKGRRSYWYDSVRLFRQPKPGDWRSVIAALGEALASFVKADFLRG
ncbi:MAG TPA: tetratricopeptide repeat protein [Proteobacteria bacterium]|nr:tetratricopeptide repeat protein [Pseudomonadota bacterium]